MRSEEFTNGAANARGAENYNPKSVLDNIRPVQNGRGGPDQQLLAQGRAPAAVLGKGQSTIDAELWLPHTQQGA